ncbi:UNVERIFIED_CONTAM: methyltransferase type 11 [Euhalothece sp. KZN 001]
MNLVSPITKEQDIKLLSVIKSDQLIQDWKRGFGIDISEELKGCEEIKLYECNKSKLRFFMPIDTAGSDQLYEQLEKYDWYYMPRKWEHDVAVTDLQRCQRVLEVGCGRGAFVERLCKEENIDAEGVELNSSAVSSAKAKGINVYPIDLHELAEKEEESYDAVCSFQVLEHVPDPLPFLESMLTLLKPQGKLIISVPNAESFLQHQYNLLDMPPHHVTQWSESAFRFLNSCLPVKVDKIRREPLAEYHINGYLNSYAKYYRSHSPLAKLAFNSYTLPVFKKILKSGLRKVLVGQSIYVQFSKL